MNAQVSEEARLASLAEYRVVGSVPDPRFDPILANLLASCSAAVAKIAFIDEAISWVKASNTTSYLQVPREASFCAKYIVDPVRTVIESDLGQQPDMRDRLARYSDDPCAAVAGVPLIAPSGAAIGALIVIDTKPRDFTMTQIESLTRATRKVMEILESTRAAYELAGAELPGDVSVNDAVEDGLAAAGDNSHSIVDEFVTDNLTRSGWWAAQIWWAEDDQLFPEPWIVDPAAPEVVGRLRSRAGSVPIPYSGVEFSQPSLLDIESAPWMGNTANIAQAGVRHLMVLDISGALTASLRLVFVVPEGVRVNPETLSTLQTGALLLSRVLRQEQARGELLYRSTHDALTGLLNRRGLDQVVAPLEGSHTEQVHAVIYLDLDRFKQVNDTHGHAIGDQLLKHVSAQIQRQMRPTDSVVRLGGDEFVVLAQNIGSSAAAYNLGRRLLTALNSTFVAENSLQLKLAASIGVAIWRTGGLFEEALKVADALMYQAKQAGGSLAVEELAGSITPSASTQIGVNPGELPLLNVVATPLVYTVDASTRGVLLSVESPLRAVSVNQVFADVSSALRGVLSAASSSQPELVSVLLRFSNHFWNHGRMIPEAVERLTEAFTDQLFSVVLDASLVGARPSEAMTAIRQVRGVGLLLAGVGAGVSRLEILDQLEPTGLAFARDVTSNLAAPSRVTTGLIAMAEALGLTTYALDQPEVTDFDPLQNLGISFYCNSKPLRNNNQGE